MALTYLGRNDNEFVLDLAIGSSGEIYVLDTIDSSDFPSLRGRCSVTGRWVLGSF